MTPAPAHATSRRATRMEFLLREALDPACLVVEDESARHAGHGGAKPDGETHYKVTIASNTFQGLSRLERSRLVHTILAKEFDLGLHALSLDLHSGDER